MPFSTKHSISVYKFYVSIKSKNSIHLNNSDWNGMSKCHVYMYRLGHIVASFSSRKIILKHKTQKRFLKKNRNLILLPIPHFTHAMGHHFCLSSFSPLLLSTRSVSVALPLNMQSKFYTNNSKFTFANSSLHYP